MTLYHRTKAFDQIHFATMALEAGARKMGISPVEMYHRLQRQGLISRRLIRHYDLLHTQSLGYVADDIVETLLNWEAEEKNETK